MTEPLPPITLVLGGARSGKSTYAEKLVEAQEGEKLYLATAMAYDEEMAIRIEAHKKRRGAGWHTVEEELDLLPVLRAQPEGRPVLIDCLTLWLSNVMGSGHDVDEETKALVRGLGQLHVPVVLVSNEVGMGLVPDTPLGRRFRDAQGALNQDVAAVADRVVFVAAGLPLILKHEK